MEGGHTVTLLCTLQSMGYEWAFMGSANIGKVALQLICNTGEVGVDRVGVDVGGVKSDKEGECLLCRFNVQAVEPAKGEIGIKH